MSKNNNTKVLREYVRSILNEDVWDYGSPDALQKIFVEPFTKASTVIKGEVGKLGSALALAVKSSVIGIMGVAGARWVPDSLKRINKVAKDRIHAIEKDPAYEAALKDVSQIAQTSAQKILFMTNPAVFLTGAAVVKAHPVQVLVTTMKLLSSDGITKDFWIELARARDKRFRKTNEQKNAEYMMRKMIEMQKEMQNEALISEIESDVDESTFALTYLKDPKVVAALKRSKIQQTLPKKISNVGAEVANMFLKNAQTIASASTIEDLIKFLDAGDDKKLTAELTTDESRDAALEMLKIQLMQQISAAMQTHLENLEMNDQDNEYKKKILETAAKISNLVR